MGYRPVLGIRGVLRSTAWPDAKDQAHPDGVGGVGDEAGEWRHGTKRGAAHASAKKTSRRPGGRRAHEAVAPPRKRDEESEKGRCRERGAQTLRRACGSRSAC
jgi:hypothetical protein